jgi:hypothetical protein
VYKHPATTIKALLNETIGGGEVLQQVLVFDVVNLDYMMAVGAEEVVVGGHAQHVRDVGLAESVTPAQREDAVGSSASWTQPLGLARCAAEEDDRDPYPPM